jgi:hypothetical protein
MKKPKRRMMTLPEKHRALRKQAMPEVLKLVKKYGRKAISGCLTKVRETEKAKRKLAEMQKEIEQLKRSI